MELFKFYFVEEEFMYIYYIHISKLYNRSMAVCIIDSVAGNKAEGHFTTILLNEFHHFKIQMALPPASSGYIVRPDSSATKI